MRRLLLILPLLLAACSTGTSETSAPAPVSTPVVRETGDLIGLDANDLAQRFGAPDLQIREGDGTKLQFRGRRCVLDAYLYPAPAGTPGIPRVTHVDARDPNGNDVDKAGCIASLAAYR